ncbi:MAG: ABC transporter substrate-binding protein, partial [Acetobacteraceae bacterium]
MSISRRGLLGATAVLTVPPALRARAQAKPTIRVGVLTDLSGTYRDNTGPNSVACARQAIKEFDPGAHGFSVELIQADHQNKPDVASSIARQWFDQGIDAVIDVPTSSVALAVGQVARDKNKIMLNGSAASEDVTDAQCSPNTIRWSFNNYTLAQPAASVVKAGGKSWFFITADYVFG